MIVIDRKNIVGLFFKSTCILLALGLPLISVAQDVALEISKSGIETDPETVDIETIADVSEKFSDDLVSVSEKITVDTLEISAVPVSLEKLDDNIPEAFHVLDLVGAQRRAVIDNPSIAAGAERVKQVQQVVKQARSMYYPQIDMSYSYSLSWLPSGYTDSVNSYLNETEDVLRDWRKESIFQSTITRQPSLRERRDARRWYGSTRDFIDETRESIESPVDNTSVSITLGWLLFDGFAREFTNAMAKHGYEEAQAAFREGQRILLDAVSQAYYGAQMAREQVTIATSDVAFYERLHKEAQARREVGRGATSHVLSFQTLWYAARTSLLLAERNYETARIILAMLLGMPEGRLDSRFDLAALEEETPETMILPDEGAMLALAFALRPDLEQRELGLRRTQAAVKREYAGFAPQIAAVGQVQTANVNESGFDSERITTTVALNASLNIFSGGRRRAQVIEAKHARREAELRIVESEQEITSDVYQAMTNLKVAQEALALQREAAGCIEKNRNLVELEYNAGKAMLVGLSQAQREYTQAMGVLAQARVGLQQTWQALHAATGTNLDVLNQEKDEVSAKVITECCETIEE